MAESLPTVARDIVERVRLSFRAWAPAESRPPRLVGRLRGGQSNLSVLLRGEQGAWVVRIPRTDRPDGVDYAREGRLHRLAAAHSLAPGLALAEPDTGLLVTAYLAQGEKTESTVDSDRVDTSRGDCRDAPEAIARLLRAIHALDSASLPATEHEDADTRDGDRTAIDLSRLDAAAELDRLRRGLGASDPLHNLPPETRRCLLESAERSHEHAHGGVICHNDLLRGNRLTHHGRLVAIDWEYARPGDPYFDLAVVASELDPDQRPALLAAYLQRRPGPGDEQRLMDQLLLYAAIAACWYRRHGSTSAVRSAVAGLVAFSTTPIAAAHQAS